MASLCLPGCGQNDKVAWPQDAGALRMSDTAAVRPGHGSDTRNQTFLVLEKNHIKFMENDSN